MTCHLSVVGLLIDMQRSGSDNAASMICYHTASCLCEPYAAVAWRRVIQNLEYLLEHNPGTHIVVLGLLPRGMWKDPKDMYKLPSAFSRAISAVNEALEHYAFGNQHTHYVDCTKSFVQTGTVSLYC